MKKIQERFKDDKQRMNQEMMRFYQENKVNPLGSCLPLLLQIPFFIALFELLRSSSFQEEIEGAESFLFIPDLAEKLTGHPVVLAVMLVLYVGTQLAASAVTMVSADPTQRRIMLALPFVFVLFIINFQAGLMVYWVTTNVWTIGQQLVVRKLYPRPDLEGAAAADDGAGAVTKPARGKPASDGSATSAGAAKGGGNGKAAGAKAGAKRSGSKGANGGPSNGARAKPPPGSPRKKKKRSGRRR
jgi:YidC/Oxa1 family membrane protein insertase